MPTPLGPTAIPGVGQAGGEMGSRWRGRARAVVALLLLCRRRWEVEPPALLRWVCGENQKRKGKSFVGWVFFGGDEIWPTKEFGFRFGPCLVLFVKKISRMNLIYMEY